MSTYQDDLVLVERAQSGDRTAFDDLVYKYEQRAYQYAYRLTGSGDEASDVVANAFVRVYNALPNFKGQAAFTTWLYRIITNCYLDAKKKQKSRQTVSLDSTSTQDGSELERQIESQDDTPIEIAERNAREQLMQQALLNLPEYQRAMLIMYHVDGLAYEEIADSLDLPLGTVKSRLNRARMALREILKNEMELFNVG